mgnify:CR=1 FL=1
MIEHAIENDFDIARMRFFDETEKERVRAGPLPRARLVRFVRNAQSVAARIWAEVVIDMMKRGRVILVRAAAIEDGIEIDRVDVEAGEIVQTVDHALHVAAVTPRENHVIEIRTAALFPRLKFVPIRSPRRDLPVGIVFDARIFRSGIVRRIAVAKALGKDLIPHRAFAPFRNVHSARRRLSAGEDEADCKEKREVAQEGFLYKKTGKER